MCVEKSTKSAIVKHAQVLTSFFLKAFDLRRIWILESRYTNDIDALEGVLISVIIKTIFKLNDVTFRPMFVKLLGWASDSLPRKDKTGRMLRLISFFNFLDSFLESLKVRWITRIMGITSFINST
jgi:U3 small nucleolar RNA-associated protein 10